MIAPALCGERGGFAGFQANDAAAFGNPAVGADRENAGEAYFFRAAEQAYHVSVDFLLDQLLDETDDGGDTAKVITHARRKTNRR